MSASVQASSPRLYAGTYARNGGAGLHPLYRGADGDWSVGAALNDVQNASFGAYSTRHQLYYFVDERSDGAIGAYRLAAGHSQRVAQHATHGAEPCYVALDAAESRLAVANYGSGSVALFGLDANGLPIGPPQLRRHQGHGPVAERQAEAHAHCACFSPDQRWLYHVDLGADQVLGYPAEGAILGSCTVAFAAPAGSGPRHLVFHPARAQALLLSELASTLTILDVADGAMTPVATLSTLPTGFTADSLGGHLSCNAAADRVYVTNRGHDSLAVFAWREEGSLELLQHIASDGMSPRSFVLLEQEAQLVVAHEQSSNVTVFDVAADGTLAATATSLSLPGAVFLIAAV